MREGLAAADVADYETALRHFRRAMELVPEANLPHRHAARALEELGRWEEALAEHETYLRIKPDVSDAQTVRERIAEIRRTRLAGTVTFVCEHLPSGILVDGNPAVPGRDLRLTTGSHRLRLSEAGLVPRDVDVIVPPGGSVSVDCTLERITAAPIVPAPALQPVPPRREEPRPAWYARWYTWAGAGAVVVGATVAAILIAGSGATPPPATEGGNHRFP